MACFLRPSGLKRGPGGTMKTIRSILRISAGALFGFGLIACSSGSGSGNSQNQSSTSLGTGSGNIANCAIFPADNPWNRDVSKDPVDSKSSAYLAAMSADTRFLHPDFGSNPDYGIPYTTVKGDQAKVPVSFEEPDESDPGPYPIPANAPIEVGDAHVLVVDTDHCLLYEMGAASYVGPGWEAFSGAIFDLNSNKLRPDSYTSADAAGLPILPGLVRYDEAVEKGSIRHALRFTVNTTQKAYIHPATHQAGSTTDADAPPMGLRVRLKADFDLSGFTGASRVVLEALKVYGMFLADNGSDWYISGSTDTRWNDDDLEQIKTVPASAFEVVQSGPIYY